MFDEFSFEYLGQIVHCRVESANVSAVDPAIALARPSNAKWIYEMNGVFREAFEASPQDKQDDIERRMIELLLEHNEGDPVGRWLLRNFPQGRPARGIVKDDTTRWGVTIAEERRLLYISDRARRDFSPEERIEALQAGSVAHLLKAGACPFLCTHPNAPGKLTVLDWDD